MKKTLFMIACLGLLLALAGCKRSMHHASDFTKGDRFEYVYAQSDGILGADAYIIRDTETGIKYLFIKSGYGAGLTKLEE